VETIGDPGGAGVALFVACTLRRQGFALVAQRIEQKTFRLQVPPPHRTTYKGSRREVRGRAMGVRLPQQLGRSFPNSFTSLPKTSWRGQKVYSRSLLIISWVDSKLDHE
jgi:hypothetical protein